MCFLKIAAGKSVEVFTGVSSLVHTTQHSLRCGRITSGLSGVFTDLFRRFHQSTLHTTHKFNSRFSRYNSRYVYIKFGCPLCYQQLLKIWCSRSHELLSSVQVLRKRKLLSLKKLENIS